MGSPEADLAAYEKEQDEIDLMQKFRDACHDELTNLEPQELLREYLSFGGWPENVMTFMADEILDRYVAHKIDVSDED